MTEILRDTIKNWYRSEGRDLPWRGQKSPYRVWLSEIILQQTRINQGLPYYLRFIEAFPELEDMASATEEEVLKLWQGLGYYSRGRNLYHTAQHIYTNLDGQFPNNYDDLIELKGIGPYTAAAISSICYGEARAVLDGNVFRVLSRLHALEEDIADGKNRKIFQQKADELLDHANAGAFNQAMMDLGSMVCTPKQPKCHECPASEYCQAYQQNIVEKLPVKLKKTKKRHRSFNYFLIQKDKSIAFNKRKEKDIWAGLYELPLLETTQENVDTVLDSIGITPPSATLISTRRQILSHQVLHITFWHIEGSFWPKSVEWHLPSSYQKLPFSRPIADFVQDIDKILDR